jgi:hypothetical protein
MPGWIGTITAIIIITGIITSISVITIASTVITETDPRGAASSTLPPPRFADISPGPHAIASPMAAGRHFFAANLHGKSFCRHFAASACGKSEPTGRTEMRIPFGAGKV